MADKNRPRDLIRDITCMALVYTRSDYPKEQGYIVTRHGRSIWVAKWSKKRKAYLAVLTIEIAY